MAAPLLLMRASASKNIRCCHLRYRAAAPEVIGGGIGTKPPACEGQKMGVGPTEGSSLAPPPDRTDTKSGSAGAAPATDKPLPTNVTPGNLAPSKSPADIKKLDAAIAGDLDAVTKATENVRAASLRLDNTPSSQTFFSLAQQNLAKVRATLGQDVKLAFTARLPRAFDRVSFDRNMDLIAGDMTRWYGSNGEISDAIKKAKIEIEVGLPDAEHAAVIMQRVLNNPPDTWFISLNSVYRNVEFKAAIRNDPGYKEIIDAKVRDCFVGKDRQKLELNVALANVRAVIEFRHAHSDIKQDFLNTVLRYAETQKIALPSSEIEALRAIVLGGPM